jgi:branched-subunit amino acid ABC-type transport system permease component
MFEQTLIAAVTTGAIYAVLAAGFSLAMGTMSVVDFAYGTYVVLGALVAATLPTMDSAVVDVVARLAVGLATGGLAAAVVYAVVLLRLTDRGHLPQLIATLGIALVVQGGMVQAFGANAVSTKSEALPGAFRLGDVAVPNSRVAAAVIGVAIVIALGFYLSRSRTGKAWRAVAANPRGAVLSGMSLPRLRLLAGIASGALAGLAGALLVQYLPISAFQGLEYLIIAFFVVALGGMRSTVGPVLAAFLFALVEALANAYAPDLVKGSAVYIVVALSVVLLPTGLATLWMGKERLA